MSARGRCSIRSPASPSPLTVLSTEAGATTEIALGRRVLATSGPEAVLPPSCTAPHTRSHGPRSSGEAGGPESAGSSSRVSSCGWIRRGPSTSCRRTGVGGTRSSRPQYTDPGWLMEPFAVRFAGGLPARRCGPARPGSRSIGRDHRDPGSTEGSRLHRGRPPRGLDDCPKGLPVPFPR